MTITIKLRYSIIAGVLSCTAISTAALASTAHKPAKMTCDEFLAVDDSEKPKLVYWMEGFNKHGQQTDAFVDVMNTERTIPQLVAECKKAPTISIFKKMAELVAARTTAEATSKASAAPWPTKLTCEDFIALDTLTQPKVVYWAEGFNKNGKPVDAVVDVNDTDKLVPVLVEECKQVPKQSFWHRLAKHF